jgi:excisionase family DNA binding protein
MKQLGPLYTVSETANILKVCEKTVRRLIKDERLRAIRLRGDAASAGRYVLLRRISRTLSVTIGVTKYPIVTAL